MILFLQQFYCHYKLDQNAMAEYLFFVQAKNRLKQRGLLKRFSISCYGYQPTLADIRNEKMKKFKNLVNKKSKEYNELFFKYSPHKETNKKSGKKKRGKTLKKSTDKKDKK